MNKTAKRLLIIIAVLILGVGIISGIYVGDYYHADSAAYEFIENPGDKIEVTEEKDSYIAFIPADPKAGFIFYPGAKVQYEAYAPLMERCAEKGILAVVLHMPGNLAILDRNAADGFTEKYPEVKKWYIGGHSLGGVVAAMYLEEHTDEYSGLVLLASYSSVDLSETELKAISVYGSEDGVLKMDKYKENLSKLPADLTQKVIAGGCHAYFGFYGQQKGDGKPIIRCIEQIEETARLIRAFVD